jgi:hypothetical protein
MGEGSLTLIRGIEEEFSIYLPEDELLEIYTVGNLFSVLLRILKPTPDCLSSKAFYRIRTALTSVLGVQRRSVRPATFLDDLFNEGQIRHQWAAVARESGLRLPRLHHSAMWKHWMQILSALLSFVITVVSYKLLSRFPAITLDYSFVFTMFFCLGFILWGFLYMGLLKATPFRRSVLPASSAGELARVVLSMNSSEFVSETTSASCLTSDQVWIGLVHVFCDRLGYKPEDVVPSASICVDLGVD